MQQQRQMLKPFASQKFYSVDKDSKCHLTFEGRELFVQYFKERYHVNLAKRETNALLKINSSKIGDIVEIQFYLNQLNNINQQQRNKFIHLAKKEFRKQGKLHYKSKREGLINFVNHFIKKLKIEDKVEIKEEKYNSPLTAAQAALTVTRYQFPLGSENITYIQKHKFSDKIIINPKLSPQYHSKQRKMLDALLDTNIRQLAHKRIVATRKKTEDKILPHSDELPKNLRHFVTRSIFVKKSTKSGAGNCEELANFAFFYLLQHYTGRVEVMEFKYPEEKILPKKEVDHIFVVLNRPQNSEPADLKSWGNETIILDPWINHIFNATEFEAIWKINRWGFDPKKMQCKIRLSDTDFRTFYPAPK